MVNELPQPQLFLIKLLNDSVHVLANSTLLVQLLGLLLIEFPGICKEAFLKQIPVELEDGSRGLLVRLDLGEVNWY